MTYEELKKIAQPHIRENGDLPSNSFLLLNQLHIPFKNKKQCEDDYKGQICPLYNTPAFLRIRGNEKILYFNDNTQYWNFYIYHEISHYLLGHEESTPQHEIDADMLACILVAPIENLPSNLKSVRDLSSLCKIPIDKAEMYWDIIKTEIKPTQFFTFKKAITALVITIFAIASTLFATLTNNNTFPFIPGETNSLTNIPTTTTSDIPNIEDDSIFETVYTTPHGEKYHISTCRYIKNKENISKHTLTEATQKGYTACKVCIGK